MTHFEEDELDALMSGTLAVERPVLGPALPFVTGAQAGSAAWPPSTRWSSSPPSEAELQRATLRGVVEASHAAADPAPTAPRPPSVRTSSPRRPAARVELLAFAEDHLARIREVGRATDRSREEHAHDWLEPPDPWAVSDDEDPRAVAHRALAYGGPQSISELEHALQAAVDRARGERVFGLVAGELRLSLDPVAELRALVGLATALPMSEPRAVAARDAAREVASQPAPVSAEAVRYARTRLEEALRAAGSDPRELDAMVERAVLAHGGWRTRPLWGAPHGVATLAELPSRGPGVRVAAYVPAALAEGLPSLTELPVRMIAEAVFDRDAPSPNSIALRVIALGRTLADAPLSR